VELRRRERRGPDCIGAELGAPARTPAGSYAATRCLPVPVRSVDRRGDPIVEGHRDALRTQPTRRAGPHGRKKIGRIPDGGGWRVHGRDGIARSPAAKVGYDYVHSLVDDHSRLAYSEILPNEKGATCANS